MGILAFFGGLALLGVLVFGFAGMEKELRRIADVLERPRDRS